MALKNTPPNHSVDAPGVFVSPRDDAWDHAKIGEELEENPKAPHPFTAYCAGDTRFDPNANGVFGYLDETKRPFKVHLNRITAAQFRRLQGVMNTEGASVAFHEAARIGVRSVDNSPHQFKGLERGRLTENDMQWLFDAGLDEEIGVAAWLYSRPLSDAEKKL